MSKEGDLHADVDGWSMQWACNMGPKSFKKQLLEELFYHND